MKSGYYSALANKAANMTAATLGEALSLGWRIKVRCRRGREDEERRKSSWECRNRQELDVETLVGTRGRDFPLALLHTRLKCPRCGSRHVSVRYGPPEKFSYGIAPPDADR